MTAAATRTPVAVKRAQLLVVSGAFVGLIGMVASLPLGQYLLGSVFAVTGAAIIIGGGAPADTALRLSVAEALRPGERRRRGFTLRWLLAVMTIAPAIPEGAFAILHNKDYVPITIAVLGMATTLILMVKDCTGYHRGAADAE
ncbi:hypothetical protein [Arthrobacter sp. U41]|uniref:hypothetical protein n=1 Tax=Arthrobacter sp. U41 TaxID=1849032 RepID=UPI00119E366F|nr:hypothetical protein [Arthrobacter sp. U41]